MRARSSARARHRQREREREAAAASQFLPLLPCCLRQKNYFEDLFLKAFLVASGLYKAGPNSLSFIPTCGESNELSSMSVHSVVSEFTLP